MVGNKLTAKEEEHIAIKERINQDHHAVTTVLGIEATTDDLGHHHLSDIKARSMEEPEDPGPPPKHTTTKMTKKRWGRHALPTGFTPCQYPRVSSYLMINKSTMDLRNPNPGSQITYKQ
jgi:hypothetical protein